MNILREEATVTHLGKSLALVAAALAALALAGCGGGGGGGSTDDGGGGSTSSLISGVAAAGAPIVGTVYLKDALGAERTAEVPASANGEYSIDAEGLTPPFKLKAVGTVGNTTVTYVSVATADDVGGTINITPFTDLIVASLASQVATNFYTNGNPALITTAALAAEVEDLAAKLAPVLGAVGIEGSVDLLRQSFTPGDDGLDRILDIVKVDVDPETLAVEITNIIDGSQLTGTAGQALEGTLTAPTAGELTDIEQIRQGITNFAAQFATGLPDPESETLAALFGDAFLEDGADRTQFLQQITQEPLVGLQVSGISFLQDGIDLAGGEAWVVFTVFLPQEGSAVESIEWLFGKDGTGAWKALGNQRKVGLDFYSHAYYTQLSSFPGASTYGTGIGFHIEDEHNSSGAAYAVVTGPGLPEGGLTLYSQIANPSSMSHGQFTLDPTGADENSVLWLNQDVGSSPEERAARDAAIDAAFPAGSDSDIPYTVTLYDETDAAIASYTEHVSKRPYKLSELPAAPFATITKPASLEELAQYQLNEPATVQWTLAPGTTADWLDVWVAEFSGNQILGAASLDADLLPDQTSATGTITGESEFTPNTLNIWLAVEDADGRVLATSIHAQGGQ